MKLVPGLRRDGVWMPVFTGMTALIALFAITTQSLRRNDEARDMKSGREPRRMLGMPDASRITRCGRIIMIFLDMRTIVFSNVLTSIVCLVVVVLLWRQSRGRFAGMGFLVFDFILQTTALFLIILRGNIPNWMSMVLSNTMVIAGALLGYMGLTRFLGKKSTQIHNYVLLTIFACIHTYFTFFQPDQAARNLNISVGLLIICSQCAWLLLYRVPACLRRLTFGVGIVFGLYCIVSIIRIIEFFTGQQIKADYLRSGTFEQLVLLSYQILFILLTYGLMLMVNKRLLTDITAQEDKFSKAFHSSPYAITLIRLSDGQIIEVNNGFSNITGYKLEDVKGKTTLDMHLWDNEKDRDFVTGELIKGGEIKNREFKFRHKDGRRLIGLLSADIININHEKVFLSSINDITERKKIEEALKESERRYRNLFENSLEGIYRTTAEGRLITVNSAFARMFGYESPEEALRTITDIAGQLYAIPEEREKVVKILQETGFLIDFECSMRRKDNTTFWALINAQFIEYENGLRYFEGFIIDITERKRAEDALREKEAQYHALADSGLALIWTSGADKLCNYFNQPWLKFTGRTLEEELGNGWTKGVHPEDLESCIQTYVTAFDKREAFDMEYRLRHVSGEYRWLRDLGVPYFNINAEFIGYIGHCFDIAERKHAEEELRNSQSLLATAFESTADGILVVDLAGKVTMFNQKFLELWRIPEPLVATRDDEQLLRFVLDQLQYPDAFLAKVQELYQTPDASSMDEIAFKEGRLFERYSQPRFLGDTVVGRVWSFRDITERKQAEEALQKLTAALEQRVAQRTEDLHKSQLALLNVVDDLDKNAKKLAAANESLDALNKELEAFAYSVSHDLRSPLRSIDGFSAALVEDYAGKLDKTGKDYIARVRSAAQHMGELIDDILKLSRVSKASFQPTAVNLSKMVQKIANSCKKQTGVKNINIQIQEDITVTADASLLEIALTNLIDNAFKFTGKKEYPLIEFGVKNENGQKVFYIRDNGAGFDMTYADKIFGPFQRLHNLDEFEGTGIGLATVQRIINRHSGQIWAEGEVGKGAVFYFTIP